MFIFRTGAFVRRVRIFLYASHIQNEHGGYIYDDEKGIYIPSSALFGIFLIDPSGFIFFFYFINLYMVGFWFY